MTDRRDILLVEDSDTQALKLSLLLENEGLTVYRAASGEQALGHMSGHRPDLVIVDYHLPGMDGDELCRLLRLNPATEAIPLLILTDDAETETERHGLESGADDHVTKSADADVLLARIHALLRIARTALPRDAQQSFFESQKILVVDDSPTYLAFLEHELRRESYRVATVGSGEEALAHVNRWPVDCIVVDLVMPGIDGIELCRRLHSFRRASHLSLPVLMVTGQDSKEDMMHALEAGADDFVSKASDIVILKARIRALLRRKMLRDVHERVLDEFRQKELEVIGERAAKEAAEVRAGLVAELEATNRELKETQAQLVHSAKMVSLGELVAGIAHEVNNPLAYSMSHLGTVTSALDHVATETEGRLSDRTGARLEKARRRLDDIRLGLERVRDLVTKLRTFSRLDEGEFKQTDLRHDIESTLTLVGHRLSKRVRVTAEFTDDNLLYCAPGALNQAVMNIMTNAIDAAGEQGAITIATRRSGDRFEISIGDTGSGVPSELRDRIFEPFFTTKDVGAGTGLGLAIAYRIIERHRGSIEVRDRPGGGAEFVIVIPTDLEEPADD